MVFLLHHCEKKTLLGMYKNNLRTASHTTSSFVYWDTVKLNDLTGALSHRLQCVCVRVWFSHISISV